MTNNSPLHTNVICGLNESRRESVCAQCSCSMLGLNCAMDLCINNMCVRIARESHDIQKTNYKSNRNGPMLHIYANISLFHIFDSTLPHASSICICVWRCIEIT